MKRLNTIEMLWIKIRKGGMAWHGKLKLNKYQLKIDFPWKLNGLDLTFHKEGINLLNSIYKVSKTRNHPINQNKDFFFLKSASSPPLFDNVTKIY